MNLLQVFFIVSWFVILIFALEIAKKQKFNALHFFVFVFIWFWLLTFTFFPKTLNWIWQIFWLQRWADVLVYVSIIFLIYFVLLLLRKVEQNSSDLTKFIREIAINNSSQKIFEGKRVILIRAYNEEKVVEKIIKESMNKIRVKNVICIDKRWAFFISNIVYYFFKNSL